MPSTKRSGTSECTSTATSPCRPCVFRTRARLMYSSPIELPCSESLPARTLFEDLERVALLRFDAGRTQQSPQRPRRTPRLADHPAQIALGNRELKHDFALFLD